MGKVIKFWDKWITAGVKERIKIIEDLCNTFMKPYLKKDKIEAFAIVLNAYFQDLLLVLEMVAADSLNELEKSNIHQEH